MNPATRTMCRGGAGLSLVELLIGVTILSVFLGSLAMSSRSMLRLGVATDVRSAAQELGATTVATITDDLRISGVAAPYPHLFVDGAAAAPFELHAHASAAEHAAPGDPDHGPNREIVFRQPADEDQDGEPDFDAGGNLLWNVREISYVLVTASDGVNQLERRVAGRTQRVVARHVERVLFEDTAQAFDVPLGSIRVRLWFRLPDGNGGVHRHRAEATVALRN